MKMISHCHRQACRQVGLSGKEKTLFMLLLREISVNAARLNKDWSVKEHFLYLFPMAVRNYPELGSINCRSVVTGWIIATLQFDLQEKERDRLWI